jgi:hypothetical protein
MAPNGMDYGLHGRLRFCGWLLDGLGDWGAVHQVLAAFHYYVIAGR